MFKHNYIDILEAYSELNLGDYREDEIDLEDWYLNLKRTLKIHPELEDIFFSYPIYSYKDLVEHVKLLAYGKVNMEGLCRLFEATLPEDYRDTKFRFELEGETAFKLRATTLQELTDELLKRIKDNANH